MVAVLCFLDHLLVMFTRKCPTEARFCNLEKKILVTIYLFFLYIIVSLLLIVHCKICPVKFCFAADCKPQQPLKMIQWLL